MTSVPSAEHASSGATPVDSPAGAPPGRSSAERALPRQRGAAPTPPRRTYRALHVAAGGTVLLALGAALALPSEASAHTVTGTVLLGQQGTSTAVGGRCTGQGADADVEAGAPVRIIDATGEPLAQAVLGPGRFDGRACAFTFLVPKVARAGAYRISVGTAERPGAPFTYREMRAQSWSVRLTLGA